MLTRESVLAEGVPGGFTAVYGVLKVLEERGQVRRGYFVTGLGAAQFALPGAVDRLRSVREAPAGPDGTDGGALEPALVLAATDPAQRARSQAGWDQRVLRASRERPGLRARRDSASKERSGSQARRDQRVPRARSPRVTARAAR